MLLRWTPGSTRLAFVMLLCVAQYLIALQPTADPAPGRGIESRLLLDGVAAFDAARSLGGEVGAPAVPGSAWVVDLSVGSLVAVAGAGFGTLRLLPGICALLFALFGGLALRRRYGDAIGLIGTAALLIHATVFAWARTPSVVPFVWLTALALLALATRRERWAPWLAACLASMATALVHPTVGFVIPALLVEGTLRLPTPRRVLSTMPFPAAVMGLVTMVACWGVLPPDVRRGAVEGLLGVSSVDAPPLLAVVPVALPFAWAGFLILLGHAGGAIGGRRAFDRLLHGAIWIPLAMRTSVGAVDAASCAELLPFIVLAAVATVGSERGRARRRVLPWTGARGACLCFVGVLGTLTIAAAAREVIASTADGSIRTIGLALPAAGIALVLTIGLPAGRRPSRRALLALGIAFLVLPGAWGSLLLLGHTQRTWEEAAHGIEGTLLTTHRATGAWARLASIPIDLPWGVEEEGATHRLDIGVGDGKDLEVGAFSMLGHSLLLTRIAGRRTAYSAFEEGRVEELRGEGRAARRHYFRVLRSDPDHAPSWERIAATLFAEKDFANGYRCLLNALHGAPDSASIRHGLASLYARNDRFTEARHHLERAAGEGTDEEELAPLRARIGSHDLR